MVDNAYNVILEAVAQGWCTKENENKCMDVDLAVAITKKVFKALYPKTEIPIEYK